MDKRTLLAFGLMILVLFGWNALFTPDPPPEETAAESVVADEPQVPEVAAATPSPRIDDPTPVPAEPAAQDWDLATHPVGEVVPVETDIFRAAFDRVGGDLVSWELKAFDRLDGAPVDLVSPIALASRGAKAHDLRLVYEDRVVSLERATFTADRRRVDLSDSSAETPLIFTASTPEGGTLAIEYTFRPGTYGFDVEVRYEGSDPLRAPTHLIVDWPGGIASSEPDTVQEYNEFKAVAQVGGETHKKSFKDLKNNGGAKGRVSYDGTVAWAGALSRYFAAIVLAPDAPPGRAAFDGDHASYLQTFRVRLPFERETTSRRAYSVYLGPLDLDAMASYAAAPFNSKVTDLVDMGPSIFRWLSAGTLWSLKLLYKVIPNYGLVIILFSALTKLLFYPLTKSSTQSMRRMSEVQPELTKLREKYKDDSQKQSAAMMELYKKHGISPLGGCLPLVVQMPVFFALFTILRKTIELRQAGFAGWISDLSRPDVLFELPFTLPILGSHFSVLPILMAVGMWLQTKLSQAPGAAQQGGAMAAQMKMMGTMMPIFMFVMFYNSPSGLVLYWFVNTVLTALQTWRIHQKMSPVTVEPQAEPA